MNDRASIIPISLPLPLPHPAPESVNVYLIQADPLTLVDTGLKDDASLESLGRALAQHGFGFHSIQRILITHGHVDHFGAARELQRRSGAEVLISAEDLPKVTDASPLMDGYEQSLQQAGIPRKIIDDISQIEKLMGNYSEPLETVTTITAGSALEFEHFSLELLHLPGHSSGHTALYWPGEKTLIAGDMVLPHITTIPVVEFNLSSGGGQRSLSLKQMLGSLRRLCELDLDLVFPGHGAPIMEPRSLIGSRIAFYEKRLEEVYALLKASGPQTPYHLALAYFKWVKGFNLLLAVCEIIVNLDLLVHQGRASEEVVDGTSVFTSVQRDGVVGS